MTEQELTDELKRQVANAGLQLVEVDASAPGADKLVDAVDPDTEQRFVFSIGPGPMLVASCVFRAPPVSEDKAALVGAQLQSRFPHVRVHLRGVPDQGTYAFIDGAHALDPDAPRIESDDIRNLTNAIGYAAQCIGLAEPILEDTDGLLVGFSPDDERRQQAVHQVLDANEVGDIQVREAMGGPVLMIPRTEDSPQFLVAVRDATLVVHSWAQTKLTLPELATVASRVQGRLPFGRVMLNAGERGIAVLEYTHRLGPQVSEFDVLHSLGGVEAMVAVFASVLAGE